jgi:hypothetical protein
MKVLEKIVGFSTGNVAHRASTPRNTAYHTLVLLLLLITLTVKVGRHHWRQHPTPPALFL